jgi:fibronectin type 3 domain-containing protein
VTLTWTAAAQTASYNVYRDNVLLANVLAPTLTYVDSQVAANQRHRYMVTAINTGGLESTGAGPIDVQIPPGNELDFKIVWTPEPGHLGPPDLNWTWK